MIDDISNSYRALELKPGASPEEVKEAYRELVKVWHPDRFGGDEKLIRRAEEKLKEINLAYDRLKNVRPRKTATSADGGSEESPGRPAASSKPRRAGFAEAKIRQTPNLRDARLGCLLVGGLAAAILFLILAAVFYDDMPSGRRIAQPVAKPKSSSAAEAGVGAGRGEGGVSFEKQAGASLLETREIVGAADLEALAQPDRRALEEALRELEAMAKEGAIVELNELPPPSSNASPVSDPANETRGAVNAPKPDFLAEQFYKTGEAHLKSNSAPRDEKKAVDWFRRAAELGHTMAQRRLATMLREGRGTEADVEGALFWILVAAGLGDVEAAAQSAEFRRSAPAEREAAVRARVEDWLKQLREQR